MIKVVELKEKSEITNQFQLDLLDWYHKNARVLPWRSTPTPYRVWISEIMLQQTRVDTVIPYFMKFISELPNIEELAKVEEEKLLKLWQGLGYYNRALNLKKAAQLLVEKYQGKMPSSIEELLSLPGIGVYTAGAIASIAFNSVVPAVDGNVLRIMSRVLASSEDINNTKIKKQMEQLVSEIISQKEPGNFNQALMDLGATICLPNGAPKCMKCPIKRYCKAYEQGKTSEIPLKINKKVRSIDTKTVFVIMADNQIAIQKREAQGLLPNLWEFPNVEGYLTKKQCEDFLSNLKIIPVKITPQKVSKHIFSHREWHMKGFLVDAEVDKINSNFVWATKDEIINKYSIPTAFKYFIEISQKKD